MADGQFLSGACDDYCAASVDGGDNWTAAGSDYCAFCRFVWSFFVDDPFAVGAFVHCSYSCGIYAGLCTFWKKGGSFPDGSVCALSVFCARGTHDMRSECSAVYAAYCSCVTGKWYEENGVSVYWHDCDGADGIHADTDASYRASDGTRCSNCCTGIWKRQKAYADSFYAGPYVVFACAADGIRERVWYRWLHALWHC